MTCVKGQHPINIHMQPLTLRSWNARIAALFLFSAAHAHRLRQPSSLCSHALLSCTSCLPCLWASLCVWSAEDSSPCGSALSSQDADSSLKSRCAWWMNGSGAEREILCLGLFGLLRRVHGLWRLDNNLQVRLWRRTHFILKGTSRLPLSRVTCVKSYLCWISLNSDSISYSGLFVWPVHLNLHTGGHLWSCFCHSSIAILLFLMQMCFYCIRAHFSAVVKACLVFCQHHTLMGTCEPTDPCCPTPFWWLLLFWTFCVIHAYNKQWGSVETQKHVLGAWTLSQN